MPKVSPTEEVTTGRTGRVRRVTASISEINVVPLVDVMLVLLIIFMVTAPMLQRGVDVNLPVARRSEPIAEERVFVTVPLSWFAIRWWRTIHPPVVSSEGMALAPKMIQTLLVSIAAFTLVYFTLLRQRIALEHTRDRLAALRLHDDVAS